VHDQNECNTGVYVKLRGQWLHRDVLLEMILYITFTGIEKIN